MQKLLIVDDHQMFAEGIRFLIEHTSDHQVIGILNSGEDVIPFLTTNPVNILLLDIDLPDASGFDLAKSIRSRYPHTKILALSMLDDSQSINRMLEAGADGYCIKNAGQDELFAAIQRISDGENYVPLSYFQQLREQKNIVYQSALTGRELEILQLIAKGFSSKQIADTLFLSTRTVETHRKNIYRKLKVHTNVELVQYARVNRII